jgi:LmbE family N-acetylglucosaminyl deacetylase
MEILKSKKNNKILIIAAHPDDEILGCGGLIAKYKDKNRIRVIFLTNGVSAREQKNASIELRKKECLNLFKFLNLDKPFFLDFPDNKLDTVPLLKIVKKIEYIIKKFKPNLVLTHYENCLNIDHKIAYQATITACRPLKKFDFINQIVSFEVPSSTEWNVSNKRIFKPNIYLEISKEIKKKINYLKFYKSEIKIYPHSRSTKGLKAVAAYRGIASGFNFAEAFLLVRKRIK